MSAMAFSSIVLACVFGGAVFGTLFRRALPDHHLSADSQDVVKLAMGLVATMSALVLGLLISSAKSSYDAQTADLTQISSRIIFQDRVLAHYGPERRTRAISCAASLSTISLEFGRRKVIDLPK